jgi:hypothetical protein
MAKENDVEDEDNPKKKMSMKAKLIWLVILIVAFVVLRQAMMILLLAMLPTLVVKFTDATDDDIWFKTVFCFNLAGIYPYMVELVMVYDSSTRSVQDQMADSMMWFIAYGGAAMGYAAMWFFPNLCEFLFRIFNTKKIERHRKKLRRLHDEWGVGDPDLLEF